jgi:hypothetical protein
MLLLVLLGLFAGAGYWNYQRNVALEQQVVRPFRTLSDGDLALLLAATEAEVEGLSAAHAAARGRTSSGSAGPGRWAEFERVQRKGRQERELGYRVSEHEASIAEMRKEVELRASAGSEMSVLLRRIFVYSI